MSSSNNHLAYFLENIDRYLTADVREDYDLLFGILKELGIMVLGNAMIFLKEVTESSVHYTIYFENAYSLTVDISREKGVIVQFIDLIKGQPLFVIEKDVKDKNSK